MRQFASAFADADRVRGLRARGRKPSDRDRTRRLARVTRAEADRDAEVALSRFRRRASDRNRVIALILLTKACKGCAGRGNIRNVRFARAHGDRTDSLAQGTRQSANRHGQALLTACLREALERMTRASTDGDGERALRAGIRACRVVAARAAAEMHLQASHKPLLSQRRPVQIIRVAVARVQAIVLRKRFVQNFFCDGVVRQNMIAHRRTQRRHEKSASIDRARHSHFRARIEHGLRT